MSMFIEMGGTRGSYPVPGKNTVKYGGNTTSCSITKVKEGKTTMAHDTMYTYTDEEYNSEKMVVQGFGHSTYSMALDRLEHKNSCVLITTQNIQMVF